MISVVTWKWGTKYTEEHVNRLYRMLYRNLDVPFSFFCVVDYDYVVGRDMVRLEPGIEWLHLSSRYAEMRGTSDRACFRRLQVFGNDVWGRFGKRMLQLDLDIVITGDVTGLFVRPDPFVFYRQAVDALGRVTVNPSVALFDAGILSAMWEEFDHDPEKVFEEAKKNGWRQSDTAILNFYLQRKRIVPPTFNESDGVLAYWAMRDKSVLQKGTKIVNFLGRWNPADPETQAESPWIAEHWR